MRKKIWYASYGSNISKERFMTYINGGNAYNYNHEGCNDKTPPIKATNFIMEHELYFSKKAGRWNNAGVAFISEKKNRNSKTLSRMYLITTEQFKEIMVQEISSKRELYKDFDIDKAISNNDIFYLNAHDFDNPTDINEPRWYGKALRIGSYENYPIFSFTSEIEFRPLNPPDKSYVFVIAKGIKENFGMNLNDLVDYFSIQKGIASFYTKIELEKMISPLF